MAELLSRRHLLVSAAAIGLASCAGTRRGSAFWSTVTGTRPRTDAADTRAYADRLPYASMLFWLDGQTKSLIVLGNIDPDQRLTWYTPDKEAITTYGPFIVATAGTEVELRRTDLGPGWGTDLRALVGKTLERRVLVVSKNTEAPALLRSTFHDAGPSTVRILDQDRRLRRIDESVVAEGRVRLLNSYWVDPATGACHKSRQNPLPTMSAANIEILKFPAPSA